MIGTCDILLYKNWSIIALSSTVTIAFTSDSEEIDSKLPDLILDQTILTYRLPGDTSETGLRLLQ
jgi:hypothetical protein